MCTRGAVVGNYNYSWGHVRRITPPLPSYIVTPLLSLEVATP